MAFALLMEFCCGNPTVANKQAKTPYATDVIYFLQEASYYLVQLTLNFTGETMELRNFRTDESKGTQSCYLSTTGLL